VAARFQSSEEFRIRKEPETANVITQTDYTQTASAYIIVTDVTGGRPSPPREHDRGPIVAGKHRYRLLRQADPQVLRG